MISNQNKSLDEIEAMKENKKRPTIISRKPYFGSSQFLKELKQTTKPTCWIVKTKTRAVVVFYNPLEEKVFSFQKFSGETYCWITTLHGFVDRWQEGSNNKMSARLGEILEHDIKTLGLKGARLLTNTAIPTVLFRIYHKTGRTHFYHLAAAIFD